MNPAHSEPRKNNAHHPAKFFAALTADAACLAGSLALLAPTTANAIPVPQKACANAALTLTGGSAIYQPMGVSVRTRRVDVFVSMDANVTANAEMRLSWSVDGHSAIDDAFGTGTIAENQQFWGARTIMDVIRLGPRTHTLTPEVRLSCGRTAASNVGHVCT